MKRIIVIVISIVSSVVFAATCTILNCESGFTGCSGGCSIRGNGEGTSWGEDHPNCSVAKTHLTGGSVVYISAEDYHSPDPPCTGGGSDGDD